MLLRGLKKLPKVSKGEGIRSSQKSQRVREQKKVGPKRMKGMRDSKEHMYTSNVWFGMSDSEGLIWDIQKYEETKGKCEEGKCGKEDRFWLVLSFKLC